MILVNELNNLLNLILNKKNEFNNVNKICSINEFENNALYFIYNDKNIDEELLNNHLKLSNNVYIIKDGLDDFYRLNKNNNIILENSNPRRLMAQILEKIYLEKKVKELVDSYFISKDSFISELSFISNKNIFIGKNVIIEPFVFIEDNVIIKDNTVIKTGAKIRSNTIIGENCIIRENSVIGGFGFGIEKDENNNNFRIYHIGGVRIGNYVEIGALNTVCSGTLFPTTIEDYVKTDDHIHIAHNVKIGKNSIITAGTIFSGSVICSENVWTGPNSTIIQGKKLGTNSLIGIGSVVLNDVKENEVVGGNPARSLEELRKLKDILNKLIKEHYDL